jgi:hypothetical protein
MRIGFGLVHLVSLVYLVGLVAWWFGGLVSLRLCFLKRMVFAASKTHQKLQKACFSKNCT